MSHDLFLSLTPLAGARGVVGPGAHLAQRA